MTEREKELLAEVTTKSDAEVIARLKQLSDELTMFHPLTAAYVAAAAERLAAPR